MTGDIIGVTILVVALAVVYGRDLRKLWLHVTRDRVAELLCDHLHAEAERLFPGAADTTRWPWLCSQPPCDHEDRWVCVNHAQVPCPDCTDISPCVIHDRALWAEMERRFVQ